MIRILSNEQVRAAVFGAYFAKGYSFAVDMVWGIYPLITLDMAIAIMKELNKVAHEDNMSMKYVAATVTH